MQWQYNTTHNLTSNSTSNNLIISYIAWLISPLFLSFFTHSPMIITIIDCSSTSPLISSLTTSPLLSSLTTSPLLSSLIHLHRSTKPSTRVYSLTWQIVTSTSFFGVWWMEPHLLSCRYIALSVCLVVWLHVCLFDSLFFCSSVFISSWLFVCLFICLFICLTVSWLACWMDPHPHLLSCSDPSSTTPHPVRYIVITHLQFPPNILSKLPLITPLMTFTSMASR